MQQSIFDELQILWEYPFLSVWNIFSTQTQFKEENREIKITKISKHCHGYDLLCWIIIMSLRINLEASETFLKNAELILHINK